MDKTKDSNFKMICWFSCEEIQTGSETKISGINSAQSSSSNLNFNFQCKPGKFNNDFVSICFFLHFPFKSPKFQAVEVGNLKTVDGQGQMALRVMYVN